MSYGFAGAVGVARETTWGTPVAVASGDFIEALSENLVLQIDRFDTRNIVGRYSEPDDTPGLRRIEGELVAMGHPHYLGHFLRGATQLQTITVVASGVLWTHRYGTPTSDVSSLSPNQPYTYEIQRDVTSSFRVSGAVTNRIVFAVQPNQDLRTTLSIIAKTNSIIARSTPTYTNTSVDPFTFDSASVSIAGGATPYVEALTITLDNQLVGVNALAVTNELVSVKRNGPQLTKIEGSMAFESLADWERFRAQTEFAFAVNFTKADSYSLLFEFPRCVFTTFPVGMPGRERIVTQFEAKARYNAGSGTAYWISLTNIKSNY